MHLCVPLQTSEINEPDSDSLQLATHFGHAKCFAIINSSNGDILGTCSISRYCPGPCKCPILDFSDSSIPKIDALAGNAIGFRLLQMSKRAALPVLATAARTLGELRREVHHQAQNQTLLKAICSTRIAPGDS